MNLTDKGHLAAGHKKCSICGKWFDPPKNKRALIVCPRCSAGDDNPFERRPGRAYPRASLMAHGEEEYE